jgi:hypothetical protein
MDTLQKIEYCLDEMTHYVDKPDDIMKLIAQRIGYTGKKFKLSTDIPKTLNSYWDGGSREYYYFFDLKDGKMLTMPANHPMFDKVPNKLDHLPKGVILVNNTIFCGKELGLTFYVNQEDLAPLLPNPESTEELTQFDKIVLAATRGLKSSYAGIPDYRFSEAAKETGITKDEWQKAKENMINKGYLNKAGAITPKGRNVGDLRLDKLRKEGFKRW